MLIEHRAEQNLRFKKGVNHTLRVSLAAVLSFTGSIAFNPEQVSAEPLTQVSSQESLIARSSEADVGIDSLTQSLSEKVTQVHSDLSVLGLDDPVGRIITRAWIGEDGEVMIGYEKLVFTLGMDDRLKPYHMLQKLYDTATGDELRLGLLGGDPLPRKNYLIGDNPKVLNIVSSLSEYFQVPYYIPSSANFGPFNVYNVGIARVPGNMVFGLLEITEGPQAGKITLANITPQLINTGLIPQEVVLDPSQAATGGPTVEIQPTATPVPKPEPQPTPTTIIFPRYPQIPLPTPNPTITQRPQIKGDLECVNRTNSALDLLNSKLPIEYNFVLSNLGIIECVEDGYGIPYTLENPPRATFGRAIWTQYRIAYTGDLVHEACHIWQTKRFMEMYPSIWPIPPRPGGRRAEEEECYNVGYQTQKKLGDHPENLTSLREFLIKEFGIIIYNP